MQNPPCKYRGTITGRFRTDRPNFQEMPIPGKPTPVQLILQHRGIDMTAVHDVRRVAAALFNVHENQVTDAMLARVRTITHPLKFAVVDLSAIENRVLNSFIRWPKCPDCDQSATGRYAGKFGCSRCGWYEGRVFGPKGLL